MKKYLYLYITLLTIFCFESFAQKSTQLYIPKEIKQAYDKGTRSYDGTPGENYFINKADYVINVDFNPETREIIGEEIITYTNNSPDTLERMLFNLYQDIFKKGNTRDWDIGPVDIHDGVQITEILFNSKKIDQNSRDIRNRSSILQIKLPNVILPGEKAQIEIHWNFALPARVPIRMGTYGDKNYFVAYWFPKVAVFDDLVGWNTRGHTGNQEFYNDFGSYEVNIRVPDTYIVWSTGVLQNPKQIFSEKYLKRIEKSQKSEDIIHIISLEDRNKGNKILKDSEYHTWEYKSEHSPDFAFAVSKSYLWDATSIQSGDRRISVNAVYKPNSKDFHEVADISIKCIDYFTNEIPGVPYPYPQITAFNGRGGMEFPGMINDGDSETRDGTLYLTAHEIGHSYYPFYTGLNEQKYAWMDEGLISFFPELFVEKYSYTENYNPFMDNVRIYNSNAGGFDDVPLMISSENVGRYAYRFQAYSRPAIAFYLLYNYLGEEKFSEALKLFTNRWKGKHPTPFDFFFTFNTVAEEDLFWFWKPWFFEIGHADLTIDKIDYTDNMKVIVHIKNLTGFPVPIHLTAYYKDGRKLDFEESMSVWIKKDVCKIAVPDKNLEKLELKTDIIPDVYPKNNTYNLQK